MDKDILTEPQQYCLSGWLGYPGCILHISLLYPCLSCF